MSSMLEKLRKTGIIESTSIAESRFFNNREMIPTKVPILNIALAGSVDGGLGPGIHMTVGESKTFKTSTSLFMVAAYLNKYQDAICLYYDSEFGSDSNYLKTFGVDVDRTLHIPIKNIEELIFDISKKLEAISLGDKVIIFIDSIGNLASKREVDNALDEKSVADLSRPKALASFWRIVTPQLVDKNIPLVAINHTYKDISSGPYGGDIVSGGNKGVLSANTIWRITKSQEKDGTDLIGFKFTINIEKSRYVNEKSKIPLYVTFDGGIDRYSGVLDLAIEAGLIVKSGGWYQIVDTETGEVHDKKIRGSDITDDAYEKIIKSNKFNEYVKRKYKLSYALNNKKPKENEEDLE